MPQPHSQTLSELRSLFRSDFFSNDAHDLITYGADWSGVLTPDPALIAFPRSTFEVASFLSECSRLSLSVVPSGGRTGLSGGAVAANGEIVLSLEKMNRIGRLDASARTLQVEAGAITENIHRRAADDGLFWPVDFASKGSSQVGGNLSTNAGGVRVIRYGLTRQWVLGLTVVTMAGKVFELGGSLEKNNTGIDLRQIFIGTEGTLGVITEAVLKLTSLPVESRTRVLFLELSDFAAVLDLFRQARSASFLISAYECLTAACLREVLSAGMKSPFPNFDSDSTSVFALIEIEVEEEMVFDAFLETLARDAENQASVLNAVVAETRKHREELWELRERIAETILSQGEAHQQDLSVGVSDLASFFQGVESRYRTAYPEFEVFIFGHIGDGNLHFFIRKPEKLSSDDFHKRCAESDQMLFEFCQSFRGSVSAEHGIGLLKKDALHFSKSTAEIEYARALKNVFDPENFLNPGKVV
ncbi:MAG: FAD-binding oxidoreductase [Cryobacterium sp.]|nr:FAD-binding oxidoreductase [Oligoflexia bacterium]